MVSIEYSTLNTLTVTDLCCQHSSCNAKSCHQEAIGKTTTKRYLQQMCNSKYCVLCIIVMSHTTAPMCHFKVYTLKCLSIINGLKGIQIRTMQLWYKLAGLPVCILNPIQKFHDECALLEQLINCAHIGKCMYSMGYIQCTNYGLAVASPYVGMA